MSIEYFVESKAFIRTGENYVVKSNETIANNTAISVDQKGEKTGVTYNKAQEINPNDKPVESINVTLNLFFDGRRIIRPIQKLGKIIKSLTIKMIVIPTIFLTWRGALTPLIPMLKIKYEYI